MYRLRWWDIAAVADDVNAEPPCSRSGKACAPDLAGAGLMLLEPTTDRERARTTAATTETNASTSHAWETFTKHKKKL